MQKHKTPRARGSDSTEETLRGKNRALQKTVKYLQQRIKQLEHQLNMPSTTKAESEEIASLPPKKIMCPSCGKGELETVEIYRPGSPLKIMRCNICKHQMKAK